MAHDRLLYVGCFVEPSQENDIVQKGHSIITASTTTFQKAFLSGFQNLEIKPDIINVPDIGSWPKRSGKIYVAGSNAIFAGLHCTNVGFLNLTYIKRFHIYCVLKRKICKWIEAHINDGIIIIVYSLIYPYIKAVIDAKRKYKKVHVCCIVLDLPEFFGERNSKLFSIFLNPQKVYSIIDEIDSFVLLTSQMKDRLNVRNRPWMLMEGIYENRKYNYKNEKSKAILYSGKLDNRFGIKELLFAFMKIDIKDVQLWICGIGSERKIVEECMKKDSRIKYFGFVDQQKVFEMQRKALLLVNPRKPEGEYTKYSFPSKTMEYMASGTPVVMYDLPCIPVSYKPYLILLKDQRGDELKDVLIEWLNKPREYLDLFGNQAKDFILKYKTSEKQIKRFVEFLYEK